MIVAASYLEAKNETNRDSILLLSRNSPQLLAFSNVQNADIKLIEMKLGINIVA